MQNLGAVAAQREFELETAPRSRASLAVRGRLSSTKSQVRSLLPASAMPQNELGLETAPRSRGSLRSGAHLAAMRSQVRSLPPASAAPSGRRSLATGRLAAQGELGLEAAPKSRGSLAVRGRSRSHRVAGSIPAADGRGGREESTSGWKRGESNEHRGHGRRAAGGGGLTNADAACAAEIFVPGVGGPQALLLELRGARDRRSWRCAPVGP
jgi:hypothetical protein